MPAAAPEKVIPESPPIPSQASEPNPRTSYLDQDGHEDTSVLQDRMPPHLRMSRGETLLIAVHGLLFTFLSYSPLWHTDLWGHLAYGRWIAAHHTLPTTEPLLPLCAGVPFVDTAWLSQLIGYGLWSGSGISGLTFLYASAITATIATLSTLIYSRTGSVAAALGTSAVFYWVNYQQLLIVRPQLAGLLLFTITLGIVTSTRWYRLNYWLIPLLFAAWANLHGSFVMGLGLLAVQCAGRWMDVVRRSRDWRFGFLDTRFRRFFVLTELAAAATLLNPYGIGLIAEVWSISGNPNFADLIEWEPLTLRMSQGQAFFAAALLLAVLYRLTPRRIGAGEVLLLTGLGLLSLWTSRMIVWWAPVAACYAGLHGVAVWRRLLKRPTMEPRRAGVWTIASLGLLWICFAYTPLAAKLIHGRPSSPEEISKQFAKLVSPRTPLAVTQYLHEHPPRGLLFNTYEWGDYLSWAGPQDLRLFVASHAHLVPTEVWRDYMLIAYAGAGWEDKLDRYGVNAILIDRSAHVSLANQLRDNPKWVKQREDGLSAYYIRKSPI